MLIRLLILAIIALAVVIVSLVLRLSQRLQGAPPELRLLHAGIFYAALAYVLIFAALFLGLHLFGYEL